MQHDLSIGETSFRSYEPPGTRELSYSIERRMEN
jgi:hypothetical protein